MGVCAHACSLFDLDDDADGACPAFRINTQNSSCIANNHKLTYREDPWLTITNAATPPTREAMPLTDEPEPLARHDVVPPTATHSSLR